ncbi:MAG: dihydropteroate synthase [Marinifilaceae bacterium]|jgi:dihydropteroate synthase|nr:dihydropteroate synthase [Marinifilaceae bacterium]
MRTIKINDRTLNLDSPKVMGILNLTPDSFYDGGSYTSDEEIERRLDKMLSENVDIIDLGAYSSRPGAEDIDEETELSRLIPAINIIKEKYPQIIVSVDTFRSQVVREIHSIMGEFIVNDISGGMLDEKMYSTVVELDLPYVMMHMQGNPQTMQLAPEYENVVKDVYEFFKARIDRLEGMGYNKIILDPGFGFGKTVEHNYELLHHMDRFKELGYPILVGVSRKSMINKILGTKPSEALTGTIAVNTLSLVHGGDILRVHDVKEGVETIKIFNAYKVQ